MAELSTSDLLKIRGDIVIKCAKVGGYAMINYGQYIWTEGEEKSLFDVTLPDTIRVADYPTAKRMVTDLNYELAQRIVDGDFIVTKDVRPDMRPLHL